MSSLEDRHLVGIETLPPPTELKTLHPISAEAANVVLRARNDVRNVLHGRDTRRQVVIVGPCSLHDPELALDYARLLLPVARELEEELVIPLLLELRPDEFTTFTRTPIGRLLADAGRSLG